MADTETQIETLARLAFQTAGSLRLTAELMTTLGWQPDGHSPADVREMADALTGMAMRGAMHAGNNGLLTEFTGREWRELDGEGL
ncbi:hypothetical protein [Nocardia sp. NPDC050710]|uniref:hypothetical protein n=1 Tax=Nocardia sp. NPDC050710 TaxID=3157220 RepID=UPI0033FFD8B8